jgi:ATP-binding cassette, subfamily F, member 3
LVENWKIGSHTEIRFNPQVHLGYYDQELALLNPQDSILTHALRHTKAPDATVRNELIAAGFPYDQHGKLISALSGGEKARLQFLALKLMQPTLLVLDEPTNHIDVHGIEVLEEDLLDSGGTCIFVSHDRRFVQSVATRFFLIYAGKLREIASVEPYYELLAKEQG